ncbi:MAG TPA: hypothetical protein VGS27_00570 [Candidatus Sulfotelmatobacter sp.]|nr:hypothetical protein [Candidatus Sulfotelmatobacter sp.]
MKPTPLRHYAIALSLASCALALLSIHASAQTCQTSTDMDAAARTAITNAGQRYFDMAVKGDAASLKQNAIPSLASDFSGIESLLKERQPDLAGAQATIKNSFLLDNDQAQPGQRDEFYCGVFGKNGQTANSAAFYLDNLPPGKYAVVLLDANGSKGRTMVSEVLQQMGNDWKLGGLYIKPAQINGHDSDWFLNQARQYKSKGQLHNAWFYYLEARNLISPLPFMSTLATDKLYDESQSAQPPDLPAGGKTADLPAGTSTYKLTAVFPEVVGSDLDLIVRYQSANVSNTNLAYQDNVAVMKAMVTKYPELRDAFTAVVARAVDPSGRDYGTLLAMKDIK